MINYPGTPYTDHILEENYRVFGNARAKFFCSSYKGRGLPISLILLVVSDEDALMFTKDSRVERFESWDPDSPDREFDVQVAFVNYASKKAPPFIYYRDNEQWVKREYRIKEQVKKEE